MNKALKLWHRILCVLLAYIFLIGPEAFHYYAQGATQYSDLTTASWGGDGDTITYTYDANGSVETKDKTRGDGTSQSVVYTYNLQGRLETVTTEEYDATPTLISSSVITYEYNPQGIRTSKDIDGITTFYFVDSYNHTGYTQVLEETTYEDDGQGNWTPLSRIYYTIGDDIIAQARAEDIDSTWTVHDTEYLLYDGHGSTRQLARPDKTVIDSYSYDGYGVMLGDSTTPNPAQTATTNLLYTGEQYDSQLDQYYLRARYYNPTNGTFNRVDPYAGNTHDPQSLHKYLYCHNNPINAIDPTGEFSLVEVLQSIKIGILRVLSSVMSIIRVVSAAFRNLIINLLRPFFRFVGGLKNIRFARPFQRLKPMDRFLRFFKAQTRGYPKVNNGWFGRMLKKAFPKLKWQQHHIAIQQRWFRPGSASQWYPADALANEGLKALGNAGWNLIALPAFLHKMIHLLGFFTIGFALLSYGPIYLVTRYVYKKIKNGSDEEFDRRQIIIYN